MEVKETALSTPQEHLTSLVESSLTHTEGSNDSDRAKVMALVPEVRKANEKYLQGFGINLSGLELNGYSPWEDTGSGKMMALPVGEDSAYLLVRSIEDVNRERSDYKFYAPRYLVMNGQVNKQVYVQWEVDESTKLGKWVLTDMRNGNLKKQEMTRHKVDEKPNSVTYEYDPAHLDGKNIYPPLFGHGYWISIRSDIVTSSETKVRKPTGWIKRIL